MASTALMAALGMRGLMVGKDVLLSFWSSISHEEAESARANAAADDNGSGSSSGSLGWYLWLYASICLLAIISSAGSSMVTTVAGLRAARGFHERMLHAVLHAPMQVCADQPIRTLTLILTLILNADLTLFLSKSDPNHNPDRCRSLQSSRLGTSLHGSPTIPRCD